MALNKRRTLELKLGKLGLALFVGGMSLLLLSVFLLGVLVGEHLEAYPEKYAGGLVDLVRDRFSGLAVAPQQENQTLAEGQEANNAGNAADDEFDLTFYQVLGNKNSAPQKSRGAASAEGETLAPPAAGAAVKKEQAAEGATPPGTAASKVPPGNVDALEKVHKAALPVKKEADSPPAAAGKPEQPPTLKADKKPGAFHVQAAAYRDVKQAEKMARRIQAMGFSVHLTPKDIPAKGRWFRVVVGGFENRKDAEQAVSRIEETMKGVKCIIRRQKGGKI